MWLTMRVPLLLASLLVSAFMLGVCPSTPAVAKDGEEAPSGWASQNAELSKRVLDTGRLVVHVLVPLCDNAQINCGGTKAGDPTDLKHNLYWGAIFGHKRFFSKASGKFERVALHGASENRLERAVFKRSFEGAGWGRSEPVELVVIFDAYRGDAIDEVVDRFFVEAETGGTVTFGAGDTERTLKVDVVGYAGHNRIMDGKKPPARSNKKDGKAIPSFVMACRSSSYFEKPLAERGSKTLLMTRDLMAPEGYVVDAIVQSLARNASRKTLRAATVRAYAKWHEIEDSVASTIFAKND